MLVQVSAYYEQAFRTQLITNIIYPQNAAGKPMYNPNGKYIIKLVLNGERPPCPLDNHAWRPFAGVSGWCAGVPRKVVVDDRLPVDKNGARARAA